MAVSEPLIRKIVDADFERVADLTNRNFPSMEMTASKVAWRLSLGYSYFVAVAGGKVVGFADIWLGEKRAKLMGMAVEEKLRGRGIGGALIKKAIEFSIENGKKTIYLDVRRNNLAAIHFYERHGFIFKKETENGGEGFYLFYRKLET